LVETHVINPSDSPMLVSILIDNYNYDRFLCDAIDSALGQTYPHVEVVVTDDGSTDDSRAIIAGYGDRIVPVYKENGGQPSAFNAGFIACRGDLICFLDADDVFHEDKVAELVAFARKKTRTVTDVHIYDKVECIDGDGNPLDVPPPLPYRSHPANMYQYAKKYGYVPFLSSPTSGIAITRSLAERLFPLPSVGGSADDYLVRGALLIGEVHGINKVLTKYRIHGKNRWYTNRPQRSEELFSVEKAYLNAKLIASGRQPTISFFESTLARDYYLYHRSRKGLVRLAFTMLRQRPGLAIVAFAVKTLFFALFLPKRPSSQPNRE